MNSIPCAYSVEGSGPALFLVHGIGSRRSTWNELVAGLRDSFTCISYDLRGHGESPVPVEEFGLDELVDDLEALRQQLDIDKIHIAGHSLGGMIGPAYARRYPKQTISLGLLSTAAGRTMDDSIKVKGVVQAMREKGVANVLPTLTDRWFSESFASQNPEIISNRLQQVVDTPEWVFLNVFDIYANTEMAAWLNGVKTPALVLTGELDGGCNPRLNQFIHSQLENSELVILDQLKHSILLEATDRVLPPVRDFLLRQG
ncbi:MAG: 3-oxoadipate enol-lactonase [Parasphingorhabdus sp.]|jgi:3-oxoadipate enol-lactonase